MVLAVVAIAPLRQIFKKNLLKPARSVHPF